MHREINIPIPRDTLKSGLEKSYVEISSKRRKNGVGGNPNIGGIK